MNNSIFADGAGYVRGRFVPIAEATLPVTDWGFTRSDVVYDVVHVFKGGFFRLADHLDRFENSMAQRRIRPPEDRTAIEAILHRCVALTASRCGITPAGRLRKPPDRLCAALDRCRSQGRAGARSPCLGRLDAAR